MMDPACQPMQIDAPLHPKRKNAHLAPILLFLTKTHKQMKKA